MTRSLMVMAFKIMNRASIEYDTNHINACNFNIISYVNFA